MSPFFTYHLTSNLNLLITQLLATNQCSLNRQLKLPPLMRVRLLLITLVGIIKLLENICQENLKNKANKAAQHRTSLTLCACVFFFTLILGIYFLHDGNTPL